jgi:hypothetical protein
MMKRAITIFGLIALITIIHATLHKAGAFNHNLTSKVSTEQLVDSDEYQPDIGVFEGMKAGLERFWLYSGFANAKAGNLIMIMVGLIFIFLAIKYDYEPLLLIPIGTGIIIGNIPFVSLEIGKDLGLFAAEATQGIKVGIYEKGSVLNYLYLGVEQGIYPPLDISWNWCHDRFFGTYFKS